MFRCLAARDMRNDFFLHRSRAVGGAVKEKSELGGIMAGIPNLCPAVDFALVGAAGYLFKFL